MIKLNNVDPSNPSGWGCWGCWDLLPHCWGCCFCNVPKLKHLNLKHRKKDRLLRMELVGNSGHHGAGHYHLKHVYLDEYIRLVIKFLLGKFAHFFHLFYTWLDIKCCFFFCGCWRSLKFGLTRKVTANDARWRPHESNSVSVFFGECVCTISHFDHRRWRLLILKQLDVATCGLWFWFMTPHDFWVVTVLPSCRISESRIMSLLLAS